MTKTLSVIPDLKMGESALTEHQEHFDKNPE